MNVVCHPPDRPKSEAEFASGFLIGNTAGEVTGVRCIRMELGAPDASGRRKPVPVRGYKSEQSADVLLIAYGFDPVPFPPSSDLAQVKVNSWGGVAVDDDQMTSVPGVFAGWDLVRGPSLVVHAVRDARKAAAILGFLRDRLPKRPVVLKTSPELIKIKELF